MSAQGMLATVIATRLAESMQADGGKIGAATSDFIREIADAVQPRRSDCSGIPRPGCAYLAPCGTVCNKCGQVHLAHLLAAAPAVPINMILHCPKCGLQHIDKADETWTNPPHRSHLCAGCGHIWRPADVPTNGVLKIETRGTADSPAPTITVSDKARMLDELCSIMNPSTARFVNYVRVMKRRTVVMPPMVADHYATFSASDVYEDVPQYEFVLRTVGTKDITQAVFKQIKGRAQE